MSFALQSFALQMDYAGAKVSEVQYRLDRAKYYDEVPDRAGFIAFCESLLKHERSCENTAESMCEEAERNATPSWADEIADERDRLQEKFADALRVLQEVESYLEKTDVRNDTENAILARAEELVYS